MYPKFTTVGQWQRRFVQLRAVRERATMYFRNGGQDAERLVEVLSEANIDLSLDEIQQAVARVAFVERHRAPA